MTRLPFVLALSLGCASVGEVPLDTAFALQFGETVTVAATDLTLTFTDVADSRCPVNITCVWQGEVTVHLLVNGDPVSVKAPGTASLAGYVIEVREVNPYPSDPPPQKSRYSAVIEVSRGATG